MHNRVSGDAFPSVLQVIYFLRSGIFAAGQPSHGRRFTSCSCLAAHNCLQVVFYAVCIGLTRRTRLVASLALPILAEKKYPVMNLANVYLESEREVILHL
jgi:hypothetical protein